MVATHKFPYSQLCNPVEFEKTTKTERAAGLVSYIMALMVLDMLWVPREDPRFGHEDSFSHFWGLAGPGTASP